MTQEPASQTPDQDAEGPRSSDDGPDAAEKLTPPSLPRVLAVFLLVVCVGLVALLLLSVLVVYLCGLAARRVGVPELDVTVAFLSLLAILVIGYVGVIVGSKVQGLGWRLMRAIEDAGERVSDEVDASTTALVETIDELPAVIVDPRLAARAPDKRRSPAGVDLPGGPTSRARRTPR